MFNSFTKAEAIATSGSLSGLAKEINQHHEVGRQAAKNAIRQAIAAGEKTHPCEVALPAWHLGKVAC